MSQEPWEHVVGELASRGRRPPGRDDRLGGRSPLPRRLTAPDLASVRVLSERGAGEHHAVALTVDDATGERYRIIRELVRTTAGDGGWRIRSGCEGLDRVIAGKPDPYVSLYAYAAGHFFAGGRVQSASTEPARIRLVWDDGYAIEDSIENGIVLLFGTRDTLELAVVEFLDLAGHVIGAHVTFIDEQ